jgi:hypothetical protein
LSKNRSRPRPAKALGARSKIRQDRAQGREGSFEGLLGCWLLVRRTLPTTNH